MRTKNSQTTKLPVAKATTPLRHLLAGDLFARVRWTHAAFPQPNFHLAQRENRDVVHCLRGSAIFAPEKKGNLQANRTTEKLTSIAILGLTK